MSRWMPCHGMAYGLDVLYAWEVTCVAPCSCCVQRSESMSSEEKVDPTQEFPLSKAAALATAKLGLKGKFVDAVFGWWLQRRMEAGNDMVHVQTGACGMCVACVACWDM